MFGFFFLFEYQNDTPLSVYLIYFTTKYLFNNNLYIKVATIYLYRYKLSYIYKQTDRHSHRHTDTQTQTELILTKYK